MIRIKLGKFYEVLPEFKAMPIIEGMFCACGNAAVKRVGSGAVCARCLSIEKRTGANTHHGWDFALVEKRAKPPVDDFWMEPEEEEGDDGL